MRIEPTGVPPVAPNTVGAAPRATTGKTPEVGAGVGEATESFAQSADLAALLAAVRQAPEVRADVIESAAAQLAAGTFDTPAAAAEAANTLLDSGDLAPPE